MGSPPFVSAVLRGLFRGTVFVVWEQHWQVYLKSPHLFGALVVVVESWAYRGRRPCWPSVHRRVEQVV